MESEEFGDAYEEDEIPEINLSITIQPYMYEPVVSAENSDSDTDNTTDDGCHVDEPVPPVDQWCSCGNCTNMETLDESVCCKSIDALMGKMEKEAVDCITQHYGFEENGQNDCVIEASYHELIEDYGHTDELVHKTYRHLAYKRFTRWIYGILRKKNRRVIPSCAVSKIRSKFPSEEYCGFKYPVV